METCLNWKEGRETDDTEAQADDEKEHGHGDRCPHPFPNEVLGFHFTLASGSRVDYAYVLMKKVIQDTNKRFQNLKHYKLPLWTPESPAKCLLAGSKCVTDTSLESRD